MEYDYRELHDPSDPNDWNVGDLVMYLDCNICGLVKGCVYSIKSLHPMEYGFPHDSPKIRLTLGTIEMSGEFYWWRFVNLSKKFRKLGLRLDKPKPTKEVITPEEGRIIEVD